jgi:hypothetical protein
MPARFGGRKQDILTPIKIPASASIKRIYPNEFLLEPFFLKWVYSMGDRNNPRRARYICDCSARCGASGKAVSATTYYRHAPARNRDLDGLLESLLAREGRPARGTEASGLRRGPGIRRSRGHANSSRQQQRTRKTPANNVVGDGRMGVSRQMEPVSVFVFYFISKSTGLSIHPSIIAGNART